VTDDLTAPEAVPRAAMDTRWLDERTAQRQAAEGLGLFSLLRELERTAGPRPRIGRNTRLRDQLVRLGQDPFLAFPDNDLARVDLTQSPPMVRAQFVGFFGAYGAFPLNWTEEVRHWFDAGDESYVHFVDIFAARFQELFFRAWSDARAITQFDHPADDRFQSWLLAMVGQGTPAFRGRGIVPDTFKLQMLPLAIHSVKSPIRLSQTLALHFGGEVSIEVEEMVPTWLFFELDALCRVGMQCSTLGQNIHLGSRVKTVTEKLRLHIHVPTITIYERFLPGGAEHASLSEIVFWYLGQRFEIDVAVWLPKPEVTPAVLGQTANLGWMACIAPQPGVAAHMVRAVCYALAPPELPLARQAA